MYVCCFVTLSYASEPFKMQDKNIYIDSATYLGLTQKISQTLISLCPLRLCGLLFRN